MAKFQLSEEGVKYVKNELSRYEQKHSAIMRSLYRAQAENGGWVSTDVVHALSEIMDIPSSHIEEVASFYTMFNRKPMGHYHVQVCCTLTCAMKGGRELTDTMMKEAGCSKLGEVSKDGLFSFAKVECLGSCDTAPMLQVNRDPFIESLDDASGIKLIQELRKKAEAQKTAGKLEHKDPMMEL